MAGTKVQTLQVQKCPFLPDLARVSGETGFTPFALIGYGFEFHYLPPQEDWFDSWRRTIGAFCILWGRAHLWREGERARTHESERARERESERAKEIAKEIA